MGFGTFFIGYFFLINITHFFFTDAIAALVMLMGAYKLSRFNKAFRYGLIFTAVFAVFSLFSFTAEVMNTFGGSDSLATALQYAGMARQLLVFGITLSQLIGIALVAKEVEANRLALSTKILIPFNSIILVMAVLETPLTAIFGNAAGYIFAVALIAFVIVIVANIVTIYKAYMQICMPEDLEPKSKKAAGGILAKFAAHEEKKSREYAEYKINKDIERAKKRNGKKNKKR